MKKEEEEKKINQDGLDDVLSFKQEFENRTYSSYMEEINKEDLLEGLLGYGLFAEKIPPLFTSKSFYEWCKSIESENIFKDHQKNGDGSNKKNNNGKPLFCYKGKDFIRYENMRNVSIPRPLAIPHPIAYRNLCQTLAESWETLQEYFKEKTNSQNHKISRIHIRKLEGKKHIFEMNYKNFEKDIDAEPDLSIGAEVLVKADISNCFPSVYTHAIPWALVTKEVAKNKREPHEYFNKIDKFTRNLKYGETHGILIGPHSSSLISEIILVAVDKELYDKDYRYIRNIDDYTCYLKNHDEAELFLLDLSLALKKYELTLNHKKTEILDLPLASTEHWVRKLNAFYFSDIKTNTDKNDKKKKSIIKYNEIKYYLDLAVSLIKTNGNDAATISYAIKVIAKKQLNETTKRYYLKRIHHLILIYPYLIPWLDEHIFEPLDIQKEEIKLMSDKLFELGISKRLWEAVSYSIFFALKYKFELNVNGSNGNSNGQSLFYKAKKMDESDDCIFLTLAYLYDKRKNTEVNEYVDFARTKLEDDFHQYWLFIYEILSADELPEPFKSMKEKNISFVKKEEYLVSSGKKD